MVSVRFTRDFEAWLEGLRDSGARRRIEVRLDRIAQGNFGDFKSVAGEVLETRVHYGPGYRIYFCRRGTTVVIILAGGDKSSQTEDIEKASRLFRDLE